MINRTKALVIGFFVAAWVSLIAILVYSPEVYDQELRVAGADRSVEVLFLVLLSLFLVLMSAGVLRGWRWVFWLIVVAFLAGSLRFAASLLELAGVVARTGPTWYVALQGAIGVVQVAIGVAMLIGYRKRGVWGAF